MRTLQLSVVGLVVAALLGGCGGARGTLAFDRLKYPVSSSPYIYAPDGRAINATELQHVGDLNEVVRLWGILYSWVSFDDPKDISDMINARIAAAGGEGVINLALQVSNCGMNYLPFVNWMPFYPGCTYVRVTGNIVRLAAASGPPPSEPPPPGAPPPPPGPGAAGVLSADQVSARIAAAAVQ